MTGDEQRWRTVAETAAHFKVGKNRVYDGVKHEGWPHRRPRKGVRAPILFDPAEDWPVIAELMRPASVTVPAVRPAPIAKVDHGMRRRMPHRTAA